MRARRPTAAFLAAALLALGLGAFLVGSSVPDRDEVRLARPVAPVDSGALDPRDIRAHNSPSVVRNPRDGANLVIANRIDTPAFSCALHVSLDDGTTWSETEIRMPEGEEPKCYAPDVAFGADGTLYLSFVTLRGVGNVPNAGWVSSSSDKGRSLSAPVKSVGAKAFQVRLLADPAIPGLLYLSWLQAADVATLGFVGAASVNVARSADGGVTWQGPILVGRPDRARPLAPSMAAGPQGELYLVHLDLGNDVLDYAGAHEGRGGEPYPGRWQLVVARSTDRGGHWDEAVVDDLVPTQRFVAFIPPFPSIAVDRRSGRVHVAYADGRAGDADVWAWTSDDGGVTWPPPRRVNDTASGDGTSQYLPRLAVSPGGRLDVVYYDRRSDPEDAFNEVSLQSSFDGGRTFTPSTRVSDRPFDSRIGFGSERGLPDLGSRLGLTASDTDAVAVWSDTRGGTEASNKQDLAVVAVRFGQEHQLAPFAAALRYGGLAVGLLSLLVLALVTVAGERPGPRRTLDDHPTAPSGVTTRS